MNPLFRVSSYKLLTHLLRNFGAGLQSTAEAKLLDNLTRIALTDIATLSSSLAIPSLSVVSPLFED